MRANSSPSNAIVASRRAAAARSTAAAAASCRAETTAAPVLMMPAFTSAISRIVSPSRSAWSMSIGANTATSPSAVLVESHDAAHPDLEHEHIDRGIGERDEGEHGEQLEERQRRVAGRGEFGVDEVDERRDLVPRVGDAASATGSPSIMIRSVKRSRCGLVNSPVRRPCARIRLSMMRLVEVLPFVPGDMHDAVGALRVVEQLEHAPRALDARLHPALALALQQRGVHGVVRGSRSLMRMPRPLVTETVKSPTLANAPFANSAA